MDVTEADGRHHPHTSDGGRGPSETADPLHRIPLIGRIVRETDAIRHRIPLVGEHITRADADLLRTEARLLRVIASRLEGRAQELDRLSRREADITPRRVRVE